MAIITKIRTRAGMLVSILIGLSLFAFILTDFLTSGSKLYNKSKMNVAEINGKSIEYSAFEKRIRRLEEITKTRTGVSNLTEEMSEDVKKEAWQDLLQENIMDVEYEKLGLTISNDELFNLIEGPNPHPIIRQYFSNPETWAIDRVRLNGYLQKIKELPSTDEQKILYLYIENIIVKQALAAKYYALARNGIYATTLEAKTARDEMSSSVDFSYIQKPYTSLSDASISVSESDLKAYYKEHKEEFKQLKSRSIKYVSFDVIPSESDNEFAKKWINGALPEFSRISEVEQYVKLSSDEPYDSKNYKKGELPVRLDAFMFAAKVGDIMGPYFENNAYKIAKLAKINYLPDSVRVSQILLPVSQKNIREMEYLSDSLKTLAKAGHDFADLARNNSQDPSAKNGGDIGWVKEGTFGPQFSDSCIYAKKGEVKITFTQMGIHIIKVTEVSPSIKKVQVGILARDVRASEQTDQHYYALASKFAGINNTGAKFEAAVKNNNPAAITVYDIKPLDNSVEGLEKPRQLIRWVFEAKEGEVSKIFRLGEKYVVATVTKAREDGYKPLSDVAEVIRIEIRKIKKADLLSKEMENAKQGGSSMDAIASKLNSVVKTANSIQFTSNSIQDLGAEPKLIAAACFMETSKISNPIAGENGVYIIEVNNKKNGNPTIDLESIRNYVEMQDVRRINSESMQILMDFAGIKDYRERFF
jgi:peptidyl-prolyl cis-trans isomerase D